MTPPSVRSRAASTSAPSRSAARRCRSRSARRRCCAPCDAGTRWRVTVSIDAARRCARPRSRASCASACAPGIARRGTTRNRARRPGAAAAVVHALLIERIAHPADALGSERRPRRAVQDHVAIAARERAVAGVKGLRNLAGPQHADLLRADSSSHPAPSRARCASRLRIEMHDLHRGVDAGIGAAGSHDFDRMIGNRGQRGFDDRLDAERMRLRLPAAKALPSYSRPRAMRGMRPGQSLVRGAAKARAILHGVLTVLAIESSRRCASCFWFGLPSCSTSSRMLRAPSGSPMSM